MIAAERNTVVGGRRLRLLRAEDATLSALRDLGQSASDARVSVLGWGLQEEQELFCDKGVCRRCEFGTLHPSKLAEEFERHRHWHAAGLSQVK
jgi:hypothetical protein